MLRNIAVACLVLALVACDGPVRTPSADQQQARATAQIAGQAQSEVGMPGINNFQERRLVRMLYELRDQEGLATYTYHIDMNGNRHLLCQSIGYGIPYAVQFSNPQRELHGPGANGRSATLIQQPEPNGLFMPDALSATWVMCADGDQTRPVYVEPEIIVSPFPLP